MDLASKHSLGQLQEAPRSPLPPGWTASSGNAVNDSGQVVGTLSNNSSFFTKAFIGTTSGSSEVLFPPGHGSTGGGGVNNSGQIAGGTFDAPLRSLYRYGRRNYFASFAERLDGGIGDGDQ